MMKRAMISESPAMTWLGGTVWVPRALRVRESTTKMRVNPVPKMRMAGAIARIVTMTMMRTAVDGLFNPLTLTLTFGAAVSSACSMGTSDIGASRPACRPSSGAYCHLPHAVDERIPCFRGENPGLRCQPWHRLFSAAGRRGFAVHVRLIRLAFREHGDVLRGLT